MPKKSTSNQFEYHDISDIQYKINRRPKKKLNYDCPKNIFFKFVSNKVAFAS